MKTISELERDFASLQREIAEKKRAVQDDKDRKVNDALRRWEVRLSGLERKKGRYELFIESPNEPGCVRQYGPTYLELPSPWTLRGYLENADVAQPLRFAADSAEALRPATPEDLRLIVDTGVRFVIVYPEARQENEILERFSRAIDSLKELVELGHRPREIYGSFPYMRRTDIKPSDAHIKEIKECLNILVNEDAIATAAKMSIEL
ncbi:MAG: hypothetical protein ACYCOU_22060 [Sulfobacillus sp.]